jgi:hypothetical protein
VDGRGPPLHRQARPALRRPLLTGSGSGSGSRPRASSTSDWDPAVHLVDPFEIPRRLAADPGRRLRLHQPVRLPVVGDRPRRPDVPLPRDLPLPPDRGRPRRDDPPASTTASASRRTWPTTTPRTGPRSPRPGSRPSPPGRPSARDRGGPAPAPAGGRRQAPAVHPEGRPGRGRRGAGRGQEADLHRPGDRRLRLGEGDAGRAPKEEPLKINDHGMDAMRYAVAYVDGLDGSGPGRVRRRPVRGGPALMGMLGNLMTATGNAISAFRESMLNADPQSGRAGTWRSTRELGPLGGPPGPLRPLLGALPEQRLPRPGPPLGRPKFKTAYGVYKHVRHLYNPAYRLGEFWASHLQGGLLDPDAGDGDAVPSALPILPRTEASGRRSPGSGATPASGRSTRRSTPASARSWPTSALKVVDDPRRGRCGSRSSTPAT